MFRSHAKVHIKVVPRSGSGKGQTQLFWSLFCYVVPVLRKREMDGCVVKATINGREFTLGVDVSRLGDPIKGMLPHW